MGTQHINETALEAFKNMILDSPSLAPPLGIQSNFINPPDRHALSLGIMITCLLIAVTMTFIRFYVKIFLVKKLHYEDYVLLAALAFQLGHLIPGFHAYTYVPVLHQWDIPVRNIKRFLLDFHIGVVFYALTILTLKLCIMMQFIRVFIPTGDRSLSFWITHIVLWTNTLFYTIIVFLEIFACKPMAKLWNPLITGGKCLNTPLEYLVCASFNFALDAMILIWTQKIIWSSHMSGTRKLQLGVLFLVGLLACASGALRVYMNVRFLRSADKAYTAALMALCTFAETASGFMVLCFPVFPKFTKAIMVKAFPESPGFFQNMKEKVFPKAATAPHAYPAREDQAGAGRRLRSLWHISTGSTVSRAHIQVERKASEDTPSESDKDTQEV